MRAAGFARAETVIAQHIPARRTLREAEVEGRLDKNWTSQLTVLSDAEFAAGVARIRAAARDAEARGEDFVLESDLRLYATTAWRRVTRDASVVYHLAPASALRRDLRGDAYAPPSLAAEGFIHCTGDARADAAGRDRLLRERSPSR